MDSRNMNVLQLIDSLQIGGAEVIAANLAAGLNQRGHLCTVCGVGETGTLASKLNSSMIRHHCLTTPHGYSLRLMRRIAGVLHNENAGVLVTHHFRQLAHGLLPALLSNRKIVHIEHDYHFYENKPVLLSRFSLLLRFVDAFVVVSEDIGDWLSKQIPHVARKIVVIQNGIDCERFRPAPDKRTAMRRRYQIDDNAVVIGTCARLEPIKNLSLLIDAFNRFARKHPSSMLCIVGEGSQMTHLKRQAETLSLQKRIIFAGVQHAVEDFLAMLDIYAITSHNEGLPVSVLEAMASGLPVVATNVGSLSDLVSKETGILLDTPTAGEVSCAFESFADNPQIAHDAGRRGRQFVADIYSLRIMIDRYEAALLKIQ